VHGRTQIAYATIATDVDLIGSKRKELKALAPNALLRRVSCIVLARHTHALQTRGD